MLYESCGLSLLEAKIEEIANLVAWIVSEDCPFTTGFRFDASGGRATY